MTRLLYFLRQSLGGMRGSPLIQLAATGALAAAVLLVGMSLLVYHNVDRLTQDWGRGVQLTVYLQPTIEKRTAAALKKLLEERPEVLSVREVSSRAAYERLERSLGERSDLLAGLERDFLPASFELRLAGGGDRERLQPLFALLRSTRGVEQVDYLGEWAERLGSLVALGRRGLLIIALIVALACLYIVASTIRLGVFARRDEIEIQKLVGATKNFVRAPFLIEGAAQGLVGAGISAALLYALFRLASPAVETALGAVLSGTQLSFLSTPQLLAGAAGGVLLGVVGSALALGRYVDA